MPFLKFSMSKITPVPWYVWSYCQSEAMAASCEKPKRGRVRLCFCCGTTASLQNIFCCFFSHSLKLFSVATFTILRFMVWELFIVALIGSMTRGCCICAFLWQQQTAARYTLSRSRFYQLYFSHIVVTTNICTHLLSCFNYKKTIFYKIVYMYIYS